MTFTKKFPNGSIFRADTGDSDFFDNICRKRAFYGDICRASGKKFELDSRTIDNKSINLH